MIIYVPQSLVPSCSSRGSDHILPFYWQATSTTLASYSENSCTKTHRSWKCPSLAISLHYTLEGKRTSSPSPWLTAALYPAPKENKAIMEQQDCLPCSLIEAAFPRLNWITSTHHQRPKRRRTVWSFCCSLWQGKTKGVGPSSSELSSWN